LDEADIELKEKQIVSMPASEEGNPIVVSN
jgi:hypothetical protein